MMSWTTPFSLYLLAPISSEAMVRLMPIMAAV